MSVTRQVMSGGAAAVVVLGMSMTAPTTRQSAPPPRPAAVASQSSHADQSSGMRSTVSTAALSTAPKPAALSTVPKAARSTSSKAAALEVARYASQAATSRSASRQPTVYSRSVCVSKANVRSGPGTRYRIITTRNRGAAVKGPIAKGWLKIRTGQWMSTTVLCASGSRAARPAVSPQSGSLAFRAWARAIDPAGNAVWVLDQKRRYTKGVVRGLTTFKGSGPGRSVVYIQPGMTWAKTRMVMAHEALHVRQIRYGGYSHSIRVFGSIAGMERSADCGATLVLRYVVRGGCASGMTPHVRNLLAGRAA